ncbi:expansin-A31, partial [Trifolium medium]|nr:expansin-A31 [Trifolium medium]
MSTQKGSMSSGSTRKRMKPEVQEKIGDEAESQIVLVQEEGFETNQVGSEEMELNISLVLEKIENFTQR